MKFAATLHILLSVALVTEAFVVQQSRLALQQSATSNARFVSYPRQSASLWMSAENEENVDTEARSEGEEAPAAAEGGEEEPQEDPEVVAIKEEIAKLESTLKEKRRELAYVSDKAEDFSKSGYARKVAEMENMRRARSMLASSNKSGAMAGVLTSFLPILDHLGHLQDKYGNDEFGQSYNALQGIMRQVYTDLGATEYTVSTGDKVDIIRMNVVEKVHSAEHPADTVFQPITLGWELQGNVIRAAECVASLGPEKVEEQAPEEEAPAEGEDPYGLE